MQGETPQGPLLAAAQVPLHPATAPHLGTHVAVLLPYRHRTAEGLPADASLSALRQFEDGLAQAMGTDGQVVAHQSSNGTRVLHLYVDDTSGATHARRQRPAVARGQGDTCRPWPTPAGSRSPTCGHDPMPSLVYPVITSLDGYVVDADGSFDWAEPDEEVHAFVNDVERPVGTHLYGRRIYEMMEGGRRCTAWKPPPMRRDYAQIWRAAEKVVYSTTLDTVLTARTRLESTFDPGAVRRAVDASDHDVPPWPDPPWGHTRSARGSLRRAAPVRVPRRRRRWDALAASRGAGGSRPGGGAPVRERGRLPALPHPAVRAPGLGRPGAHDLTHRGSSTPPRLRTRAARRSRWRRARWS